MVKRGLILFGILLIGFVFAAPNLSFVDPTPIDELYVKITNPTINVSVSNDVNTSVWIDFNDSLLGYWSFDYYNSTGVFDNSSYGNFGFYNGGIDENNITTGIRGNAIQFDGVSDYVDMGSNLGNDLGNGEITVTAWIKGTDNYKQPLFDMREANGFGYFIFNYTGNGAPLFYFAGSNYRYFQTPSIDVFDGDWHFISFYIQGNETDDIDNSSLYVDLINVPGGASQKGQPGGITNTFRMGMADETNRFNGSMDEVILFNRKLSFAELEYLYNSTASSIEFDQSGLGQGEYPYSVYAINGSGYLEKTSSRTFGVDNTSIGLNFVFPTPVNDFYTILTSPTINVSVQDADNKSVWIDWNNSLVGYWSFDYSNSTGVFDNSSYGNFGEFNGGVGVENLTSSKRGYGLEFDGVNDSILISSSINDYLSVYNNFTISAWFKTDDNSNVGAIVAGGIGSDAIIMQVSSGYFMVGDYNGTAYYSIKDSSLFSLGDWHHGVYIRENGENYAYLDGINISGGVGAFNRGGIGIGLTGSLSPFNGTLDEVMIFNRSLSEGEILALYNSTASSIEFDQSGLVEGEVYDYSVYAMDIGGHMEIESRNFTVDSTGVGLDFIFPTPADGLYSKLTSVTINVSINPESNRSVWIDWDDSLVGYWSFDYVTSSGVEDNSSFDNFATFGPGVILDDLTTGVRGQAIELNGSSNNYLSTSQVNISSFDEGWSLFSWVNKKDSIRGAVFSGFALEIYDDGRVFSYGGSSTFSIGTVSQNVWTHVGVACNKSTDVLTFYIDGVNDSSQSYDCDGYAPAHRINSLGSYANNWYFNGSLDEMMIFDRPITGEEVLAIYNSTASSLEFDQNNLADGNYDYSIYSIDNAGNMEIESRTLTVDTSSAGLGFLYPTPADGLYSRLVNQTINVTFNDLNNKSVWVDWNNSLVGYWSFDYYNSTGVFDNSSYGKIATFEGGISSSEFDSGKRGSGMFFDGTNDRLNVGDQQNFNFTTENFSFGGWIKHTEAPWDSQETVFGKGHSVINTPYSLWMINNKSTALIGAPGCSSWATYQEVQSSPMEVNRWYHIMITKTGTNVTLYIDGVNNDSTIIASEEICSSTTDFTIGGSAVSGHFFNGTVDEVMVFNRSLSQGEVLALYDSTAQHIEFPQNNLADGDYDYSVYGMDRAGNLEILSRNLTVDVTLIGLDFIFPTPADGLYSRLVDHTINVTFNDPNNKSVWVDWNNSLIGYWSFDYYNSTGIFDNSSYGNFGSFEGNLSLNNLTAGIRGNALEFDGVDACLDVGRSTSLNVWENLTLSAWVYYKDNLSNNGIYSSASSIWFNIDGDEDLRFGQGDIPWSGIYAQENINRSEWHHVAVTHNSTNFTSFYIDGQLNGNGSVEIFSDTSLRGYIGCWAGYDHFFNGSIDEFMIFNRTLSGGEILAIYDSTATNLEYSETNLVDGEYDYSVYGIDNAGNMEIESRSLTIDTSSAGLSLIYPTPADGLYSRFVNQTINVTFDDPNNKSVWVDWNNSLVGYWSFDYYNSTGVFDNSSYGNFGEFNGGIGEGNLTAGKRGYGVNFSSGGYLNTTFNGTGANNLSISFWARTDFISGATSHYVLDNSPDSTGYLIRRLGDTMDFYVYTTSSGLQGRDYTFTDYDWHFFTFVIGHDEISLSVDGSSFSSVSFSSGQIVPSSDTMSIGGAYDGGFPWQGSIDELLIFNRLISYSEVLALYNSTASSFSVEENNLADGDYDYSVYAMDNAGNLEIESRGFTVDTTPVGLSLIYPTPVDSLYTRIVNQTINTTFNDPNNKSVWVDWNNSLVGYWSFDYYNSTGIFDNSSYGNFGTFESGTNLTKLVTGPRGNGMDFDGTNNGINLGDSEDLDLWQNFTISAWVNRTGNDNDYDIIFSKSNYKFWVDRSGGSLYLQQGGSPHDTVSTSGGIDLNKWYHVVVVHNSTNYTELYIDGVLEQTGSLGLWSSPVADAYIGSHGAGELMNSSLDEVMLFNKPLSQEEILLLYNSTASNFEHSETDLADGNYNYSVYGMDRAGNLEINSRNLTVDTTDPVASFVDPSLAEGAGTNGIFDFNVSVNDLSPISGWFEDNNSLLGYWNFENTNATGVFDNSSYDRFGEFNGIVGESNLTNGPRGNGLEFNDAMDYVDTGSWNITGNETYEEVTVLVWSNSYYDAVRGDTLVNKMDYGVESSEWLLMIAVNGALRVVLGNETGGYGTQLGTTARIVSGEWSLYGFTFDKGSVKAYINGTYAQTWASGISRLKNTGQKVSLGGYEGQLSGNSLNGSIDEVMIFDRVLTQEEIWGIYNGTAGQFEKSYSVSQAGDHNYSFGSIDAAGNFKRTYRSFNVDTITPNISYSGPTPANESYTGNLIVNATVFDRNLKNVTFNFDGSSYVLNITDEYGLNSQNYTNIWVNASRVSNITNQWDVLIQRRNLAIGQGYLYNIDVYDDGNNYNSTLQRVIYGNEPPQFYSVTQYPNSTLDMDPNIFINLTANITDSDSDIDSYHLEWKKFGDNWTNVSLTEISGSARSKLLFSNFTPTEEGVHVYRFYANDTFGVSNYSQEINVSVYWDCEWRVNSTFPALAGYNENKELGTLLIENLGDTEFANNNCTLNFRTTYNLDEGRIYFGDYYFKDQTFLGLAAEDSLEILINSTYETDFIQDDLYITTTEIGGVSANTSANTTSTLITLQSGPYLYDEITTYSNVVYLTPGTFELDGYLRNLMGSNTPNVTNTAYNVSYYWSLPSGFSGTASNLSYGNISESTANSNSNTISFSDLTSFIPGVKTFALIAQGVNSTGGDILDSQGNSLISDSVDINFLCYSVADSVCVSECGNSLDPDCPIETIVIENEVSSSGGGGGGGGENPFEISEDRFELVIGEEQEFPLEIENLHNYPKEKIKITSQNLDETEIEINPSEISKINSKSSKEVRVTLKSKKYLTQGVYEILFYVEGFINKDGRMEPFKEKKVMQLFLVEISREDAEEMINESFEILKKMEEENLSIKSVSNFVSKMNSSLSVLDYGGVEEEYNVLYELFEVASESKKLIGDLEKSISRSEQYGISVLESKKTFYIAKSALERGDYYLAYQKVKEAQLTYALETKGKFNVVKYVQNEPVNAAVLFFSFILLIILISIVLRYFIYKGKIRNLSVEEKLILELMKVIQKQCFEENKLSMGQYGEAVAQYELKLSKTVQSKVKYESKLINLVNLKGKKKALVQEQKRLTDLVKGIQEDYMVKGKLETRIYEGMIKSYSSRLTDVEERLIFIEAHKALRGKGFFKALFRRKKDEEN